MKLKSKLTDIGIVAFMSFLGLAQKAWAQEASLLTLLVPLKELLLFLLLAGVIMMGIGLVGALLQWGFSDSPEAKYMSKGKVMTLLIVGFVMTMIPLIQKVVEAKIRAGL